MGVLIFRLALVTIAVGLICLEGWNRFMPFDRPALSGEPCPSATWSQVRELRFEHFSSTESRARPNGVQVRTDIARPGQRRCRQIMSRIDCIVQGPTTLRVIAGNAVAHYEIDAGRIAQVRAHSRGDRIACRLADPPSGLDPSR